MRSFQPAGIKTLLKVAPSALIVPFAIDGNCNLQVRKSWVMRLGVTLKYTVLDPIEPGTRSAEEIVTETENIIRASLVQVNKF
jgi:1-acyl-sn-glycerol-3-phosphate acyltransferase